jgi:hypothetical protein
MSDTAPPPLTRETLRALAQTQGLTVRDAELDTLLPLVLATRALIEEMASAPLDAIEPTAQYRML